ncbi:unnamed protein product [Camellia sinensis]
MTDTKVVVDVGNWSHIVVAAYRPWGCLKKESESEEDDEEHDQEPKVPIQPEPVVNKAPEVFSAPKEATREN